jgi:outer membrane protein assembly factor BamE (lipoprotein component of BamABCDE complex)
MSGRLALLAITLAALVSCTEPTSSAAPTQEVPGVTSADTYAPKARSAISDDSSEVKRQPEKHLVFKRSEIEQQLSGKTKQEVIKLLGLPQSVNPTPWGEYYDYSPRTGGHLTILDDTTGMEIGFLSVHFDEEGVFSMATY